VLKRIFSTLSVVYGDIWNKNLATDKLTAITKQVWSEMLAGVTEDQAKIGLANLPEVYPPTPMKFKSLCLAKKTSPAHKALPSLKTKPRTNKDKILAKKIIAEWRLILK